MLFSRPGVCVRVCQVDPGLCTHGHPRGPSELRAHGRRQKAGVPWKQQEPEEGLCTPTSPRSSLLLQVWGPHHKGCRPGPQGHLP